MDGYWPTRWEDVPIDRAISAMGWQADQLPSKHRGRKPYIYRGTGTDTLTAHLGLDAYDRLYELSLLAVERPKPQPLPITDEQRRKKHEALQRRHDKARTKRRRQAERAERENRRVRQNMEQMARAYQFPSLPPEPLPSDGPPLQFVPVAKPQPPRQYVPVPKPRKPRPPARPAEGWEPLKGADIESLLGD